MIWLHSSHILQVSNNTHTLSFAPIRTQIRKKPMRSRLTAVRQRLNALRRANKNKKTKIKTKKNKNIKS